MMALSYANGNIHVGHAMSKISKDIIVRSKSMAGYYAPLHSRLGYAWSSNRAEYWQRNKALSGKELGLVGVPQHVSGTMP